jgi:hypothetical protein
MEVYPAATAPSSRGFHEKACLCQVKSRLGESLLIRVMPGPTNGRHDTATGQGPLSLMIRSVSSEGRNSVKGGLPAKRTLDRVPPFRTIKTEGKGAGGLRGLVPLAEYEAEPHARFSAPSLSPRPVLSWLANHLSGTILCPIVCRVSSSIATLPSALCCGCRHGAHWCSGY